LGIPLNELLGLVNDPNFPVNCCGAGGSGTCNSVRPAIKLSSGECVIVDIECCNGKIEGSFDVVDCNTGNPIQTGYFCATYQGPTDNPDEFNNLGHWHWCGDSNHPAGILEVLENTWLVPCLQ
jgi:hypothetical protein